MRRISAQFDSMRPAPATGTDVAPARRTNPRSMCLLVYPLAALWVLLVGCQTPKPPPATTQAVRDDPRATFRLLNISPSDPAGPSDPRSSHIRIVHLEVYQLSVPLGAVSRNEAFWKGVDEQAVDVPTYELLYKNGVRVGSASINDWPTFRELIDDNPATVVRSVLTARQVSGMELVAQKEVPSQEIFYFDATNTLTGRSFERSENLWSLSFQPAPRNPEALRVALCPVVRSLRTILQYTASGDERQIQEVHPERLYDLNLRTEIAPGRFLIVAPSPEGRWPTSLGNRFLVQNGETERFEQVLLLVPRPIDVDSPETPTPPNP